MHTSLNSRIRTRRKSSFAHATPHGFTLIEILLVIALIVVLAGITVFNADKILSGGKEQAATLALAGFEPIFMSYQTAEGTYPKSLAAIDPKFFNSGKLEPDPWQNPWQYAYPGKHNPSSYDIWSMGPDGQSGTADDIGNW